MDPKKHINFSFYRKVFKNSVVRFVGDDTFSQAAALSYYMIFSLPPMLLVIFWSVGLLYDEVIVKEVIFDEFSKLIGQNGSDQIMATVEWLTPNKTTWWETIIGVSALLFMVSTFFVTIQGFLNLIFEVKITRSLPQSVWIMLRNRFLSIAMLGIITFILIFSMVISVLINASAEIIDKWIGAHLIWLQLFNYVVLNLIVLTLLFAFMFRYIPDKRLKWSDTWIGAVFTSMLFITGKSLIGFLIGNSYVANYYDASGGVLVIMLWIYYSMAIFLFGAIFTNCRSKLLNG